MRFRTSGFAAAMIALGSLSALVSRADEVTLTPDQRNFLVSFEANGRWTLSLNRDAARNMQNFSGTILASDGSFIFVDCLPRADSTGSLADPTSTFRFDCFQMGPCLGSAQECSRFGWGALTDPGGLRLAARYFLPPGGVGAASVEGDPSAPPSAPSSTAAAGSRDAEDGWGHLAAVTTERSHAPSLAGPAAANGVAATLSEDKLHHLLSFEFGGRWAASLNKEYFSDAAACRSTRVLSLTGNIFRSGGQPPMFAYCTPLDAAGDLTNPSSTFRFRCSGTGPCTSSASDCAANTWTSISDNLALPASYFLPPDGLGGFVPSDPDVKPVGNPCDPASGQGGIAGRPNGGAAASRGAFAAAEPVAGGACAVGSSCSLRVGSCTGLNGQTRIIDGLCLCAVQDLPASCVVCGGGATGQAGGACSFPVGSGSTARGACVPFASNTSQTACKFIPAGDELMVRGCSGSLDEGCGAGACCTDDPTDGCEPGQDNAQRCPGMCVDSNGCDPTTQQCGICFSPPPSSCVGLGGSCLVGGVITPGVCCEGLACGFASGFPTPVCGFLAECRELDASCSSDGQCCSECCHDGFCSTEEFCL